MREGRKGRDERDHLSFFVSWSVVPLEAFDLKLVFLGVVALEII